MSSTSRTIRQLFSTATHRACARVAALAIPLSAIAIGFIPIAAQPVDANVQLAAPVVKPPKPEASINTALTILANAPPTVSITTPVNNAAFTAPATIALAATAADTDGTITKVEFFRGTSSIGSDTTSPYTFSWTNVAAGTYAITAKATDNANAVTTSSAINITVTAANTPPTVSLTAPANNATFVAPATIALAATAADANGTVSKVEFFNGANLLGSDTTSPYTFSWTNVAAGTYAITAKATDNANAVTTSSVINITVTAANTPPTVSLTAPANNATFVAPATIALAATAADANGTVSKVEFFNGTTSLGSDTSSPYTFSWTSVAAGTYTIAAKATDNAGAITTSSIINITVTAPNAAPTVTVTAPANNATFAAPATIALAATAADTNGTISKVEFFNGTTLLGSDTTSPYTFSWTSVAAGTYAITAKATDNAGAVTTSSVINLVVNAPNAAPTVSLTSPSNNATFTAPATVALAANAADTNGTISKVEFFSGATLLGGDTTSPYTFSWTSVAAGSYAITAKATDNAGAVTTSGIINIVVSAPNAAPTVSITAPANNATFTAPATVALAATATDSNGTVTKVEFFNGATLLGSDTTSPYAFSWTSVAAGSYAITAKATDNAGAVTTSSAINITVTSNSLPTVSLTAPADHAAFTAPATIALAATASDTGGTINKVEFFNGATLLGSDTTAPYTKSWTGVAIGNYVVTAKATDNNGGVATSAPLNIHVTDGFPFVNIVAPINNATFVAGTAIPVSAIASATNTKTITKVEYYVDNILWLTAPAALPNAAPVNVTNLSVGNHSLFVYAYDSTNSVMNSDTVTFTVTPKVYSTAITSPANGATYMEPATIALTASATAVAPGTAITRIDYYRGTNLLGGATTAPYSYTWSAAPSGRHRLTAVATDNLGATKASAITEIAVDSADTCIGAPPLTARESAEKLAAFNNLPITFEANNGQSNSAVKFQARTPNVQLFLTEAERVLVTQQTVSATPHTSTTNPKNTTTTTTVSLRFVGANPHPRISGADALEQTSNYLNGSNTDNWHTNIAHFAKARYHDIYPGIDELYYGDNGKLEYDLIVAPHADPSVIRLAFSGVSQQRLSDAGDLLLTTANGILVQKRPIAYQEINGERRQIAAQYRLHANDEVTFEIGDYDPSHTLIIDPILVYSTLLGGSNGATSANGIAVSRCGEAYVVGTTVATNFPTTPNTLDGIGRATPTSSQRMAFISKFNAVGSALLYSTYLTGTTGDTYTEAIAVALDSTGHAYVVGNTTANDLPTTATAAYPLRTESPSGFIAKLNNAGNGLMYGSYLPSPRAVGVAVDVANAAYVAGSKRVFKLNPDGATLAYNIAVGGTNFTNGGHPLDSATAIAVDSAGNAYVAGNVTRDLAVTQSVFQSIQPSTWDGNASGLSGFVSKINPAGTGFVYSTYLGTATDSRINGIGIDAAGNAYVVGRSKNIYKPTPFLGEAKLFASDLFAAANLFDFGFAAKLNTLGTEMQYFSLFGGGNCTVTPIGTTIIDTRCLYASSDAEAIAVDATGNAWISGQTSSTQLESIRPITQFTGSILATQFSAGESFLAKLNPSGDRAFMVTRLGANVVANDITADPAGNAYVAGSTTNPSFPATSGALQTTPSFAARSSGFVFKIKETKTAIATLTATQTLLTPTTRFQLLLKVLGNLPGGTANFYEGATLLGTSGVYNGTAELLLDFTLGAHSNIRAEYSGDTFNDAATSNVTSLTVGDPNGVPTVSMTGIAPYSNLIADPVSSTLTNAVVTIATAASVGNSLRDVRFVIDNISYPYPIANLSKSVTGSFALPALAPGLHSIIAVVRDLSNHEVRSDRIQFTVNTASAVQASVAITGPANGATFIAGDEVTFAATTQAAANQNIANVAYRFIGTAIPDLVGSTAPFSASWVNAVAGSFTIFALAYDAANIPTISAPISINVTPALGPFAPTILGAVPGPLSATIRFIPPTNTNGSPVTSYTATCRAAGQPTLTVTALGTATQVVVTGMAANTTYSCTVRPSSALGVGLPSLAFDATPTIVVLSPTISIVTPAINTVLNAPGPTNLIVDIANPNVGIGGIYLYVDDVYKGTFYPSFSAPLPAHKLVTLPWNNLTPGTHVLKVAIVYQSAYVYSPPITVTVVDAARISINAPYRFYLAPAAIDLAATATPAPTVAGSTITQVQYLNMTNANLNPTPPALPVLPT